MLCIMKKENKKKDVFDTKESIIRAKVARTSHPKWKLESEGNEYTWTSKLERVNIIRTGVPYGSIDVISKRINVPVKDVLHIFSLPQTTYNKKRREKSLLGGRDSEVVLFLTELVDFGVEVFNNEEEKFQRWMKKKNFSLGNNTPESLLDSITGIQEVRNCLNRIEYGNLA
jgi:putative toxin-antitoxin system antitoxin component (TIGR02293 family)